MKTYIHNIFSAIILCLFCCSAFQVSAQIPMDVDVNVFPPYPTKFNIWISDRANYVVNIRNNSDQDFDYYIRSSIEGFSGEEEVFVRIPDSYFPSNSLSIGAGEVATITGSDLEMIYEDLSISAVETSPGIDLGLDGELPEGMYQLCFELLLFDQNEEVYLSPKLCSDFFEVGHSNLELVFPTDGSTWSNTDAPVTFQWMDNTSGLDESKYTLNIYEIEPEVAVNESPFEYIESGAPPFQVIEDLTEQSFIYDAGFGYPDFQEGLFYAAQVTKATDEFYDNQAKSNVNTFWYGYNPYGDDGGNGNDGENEIVDCFDRCEIPLPTNTTPMPEGSEVTSFEMGHFTIEDVQLEYGSDFASGISGTGYVELGFLMGVRIAVRFENVILNSTGEAMDGLVFGVENPVLASQRTNIMNAVAANLPLEESHLYALSVVNSNLDNLQHMLSGEPMGVPFGVNQVMDGQAFSSVLLDFRATYDHAQIDFVNMIDLSSLGANFRMGVGAADVCVSPDGFGNEFKLTLTGDMVLPLDGDLSITFKGGEYINGANYDLRQNQSPCYFEMACEGVKALNLSGIITFPDDMLLKEEANQVVANVPVQGYFSSYFERDFSDQNVLGEALPHTDLLLDFAMDDFQLPKVKGWGFHVQNAALDLSEIRNANDMIFPANYSYDDNEGDLWKGFFIRDAVLKTPPEYTESGERGTAEIHHILIDNTLSMDIKGEELLSYNQANFKGWGLGIDTFELAVLQNTLLKGKMAGKANTPVFADDEYLKYRALVDINNQGTDDQYYTFDGRVEPSDNMAIPFTAGQVSVCQNSYLAVRLTPVEGEQLAEIFLKGDIDINTGQLGSAITGNPYMELADYQIHYNTVGGFIGVQDVNDGRGSYVGFEDNQAIDCSDLDYTSLQDAFDYMMDEMIENGENVFRDLAYETDLDVEDEGGGEFIDGVEMNGLPIRFSKSELNVNDGAPELKLIMEMQLSETNLMEAGFILQGGINRDNPNGQHRITLENVDAYFSEGSLSLESPYDGSSLATDEDITVAWNMAMSNESRLNRLRYKVMLHAVNDNNISNLDSLFKRDLNYLVSNDDISGSSFQIPLSEISSSLTEGNRYAIRVQASDPEEEVLVNDGYSDIAVFLWGQSNQVFTQGDSPCGERCSPAQPSETTTHGNPGSLTSFTMGNFEVTIDNSAVSGDRISGTGTIELDFLNNVSVLVEFLNVEVNTLGQALQGEVNAIQQNPDLINSVGDYLANNVNNDAIRSLNTYLDEARMIGNLATGGTIGVPFGYAAGMTDETQTADGTAGVKIGFTKLSLTPSTATTDFVYLMSIPSLGSGLDLGLGATDICIAPDGFPGEMKIFLSQNFDVPIDGDLQMAFSGRAENINAADDQVCFLEIDCDGFKSLNIAGQVTFPQTLLVKEDINTRQRLDEAVNGYFNVNMVRTVNQDGSSNNNSSGDASMDVVLGLDMDPFQLTKLNGWGFYVNEAVIDLSEAKNATAMRFPAAYDYEDLPSPEFWTGFYLKDLSILAPADYTEEEGVEETRELNVENLLIDPKLSMTVDVPNILSYEDGSIKGWGMSIDRFELEILQNTFLGAGMNGQMGTPVQGEGELLNYEALIAPADNDDVSEDSSPFVFNAVVRPEGDITIPMMVAGLTVCQSSYVGVQISPKKEDTHLELFLKGNMGIDISGVSEATGEFKLALADFQVQYNTVAGFVMEGEDENDGKGTAIGLGLSTGDACAEVYYPDFDALVEQAELGDFNMNRSTAGIDLSVSPTDNSEETGIDADSIAEENDPSDNAMNGFPVRLNNFGLNLENGTPAFSFTVDLAFASGGQGFAAGAGLTLYTEKDVLDDGKEKIVFKNVGFDCARLVADLDFLTLVGCLCYTNDELDGRTIRGYDGRIVLNAMDQVSADLKAGFFTSRVDGATEWGTSDYHAFWWVDGKFASGTGIPMGPISLNALGGGIYWNVAPPTAFPAHDDLDSGATEMSASEDCIEELVHSYLDDQMPGGGGGMIDDSPTYVAPSGGVRGTYGLRTIKATAGLSIGGGKLLALDPEIMVTWTEGAGINEIQFNGFFYAVQNGYPSRGAAGRPTQDGNEGEGSIAGSAKTNDGSGGSKIWLSAFNRISIHRTDHRDYAAFEGRGSLYLNVLPGILYGNAGPDAFKMISHHILVAPQGHPLYPSDATVNGGGPYWHAYFGNPYDDAMGRGSIAFDLAGAVSGNSSNNSTSSATKAGFEVTGYAMLGHGISRDLPPIPRMIEDIMGRNDGESGNSFTGERAAVESRGELSDKTSGFAMGANVTIGVGFEKIIYANLTVMIGMDILLQNVANASCNEIDNIGISNFYGIGRAYAGLEGGIGIKGKILGKRFNIEFLRLSAGIMLNAGGPNPFWLEGEASVRYRIMNGLVSGSARVEVKAGEPCYPLGTQPFKLDLIDKVYPSPTNDDSSPIDPYHHPTVSFKAPVGPLNGNKESYALRVPDIDSNGDPNHVRKVSPYLASFELYEGFNCNPNKVVTASIRPSSTYRSVKLEPSSPMADNDQEEDNKRFSMKLVVKAYEYSTTFGNWVHMNENQDTMVNFSVAPLPPYEENVRYTNPIKGQRNFMEDEWNMVGSRKGIFRWDADIKDHRFYSSLNGSNYEYYLVYRDDSGEELDRHQLTSTEIKGNRIEFNLPHLDRDKLYIMQLVRKNLNPQANVLRGGLMRIGGTQIRGGNSNARIFADYTIEYMEDDADSYTAVEPSETLLHHIVFKTSRYNNMDERLDDTEVKLIQASILGVSYDRLFIDGPEKFDEAELFGHTNYVSNGQEEQTAYTTTPRIKIFDPLSGPYYQDFLKPEMNDLLSNYFAEIYDQDVGLSSTEEIVVPSIPDKGILDHMSGDGSSDSTNRQPDNDSDMQGTDNGYNVEETELKKIFNEPPSNYIDLSACQVGNQHGLYANDRVPLNDVLQEESSISPPLSQDVTNGFGPLGLSFFINDDSSITNDGRSLVAIHDLSLKYETRQYIKNDISGIVNFMEGALNEIFHETGAFYQSLTDNQLEQRFSGTLEAYNSILNSHYYNGDADNINIDEQSNTNQLSSDGGITWSNRTLNRSIFSNMTPSNITSGDVPLRMISLNEPFKSSKILFQYNVGRVNAPNNTRIGTSRRVDLID